MCLPVCAGKLFYHQASTQASLLLKQGDEAGYQRMQHVLGHMLKVFIQKGLDHPVCTLYTLQHQQEQHRLSSRAQAEADLKAGSSVGSFGAAAAAAGAAADLSSAAVADTPAAAGSADSVLQRLVEAELFHTQWKSRRPPQEASPDYDGSLVGELVQQFTGLSMGKRSATSA